MAQLRTLTKGLASQCSSLPLQSAGKDPVGTSERGSDMPTKSANVKNEKQYERLKEKGMSKQRAARIANSPNASKHGGQQSGNGSNPKQGGTTAQKKDAGRKGGKASARKS
jgi:hypothetical protein